jgi:hypothetical protein
MEAVGGGLVRNDTTYRAVFGAFHSANLACTRCIYALHDTLFFSPVFSLLVLSQSLKIYSMTGFGMVQSPSQTMTFWTIRMYQEQWL